MLSQKRCKGTLHSQESIRWQLWMANSETEMMLSLVCVCCYSEAWQSFMRNRQWTMRSQLHDCVYWWLCVSLQRWLQDFTKRLQVLRWWGAESRRLSLLEINHLYLSMNYRART